MKEAEAVAPPEIRERLAEWIGVAESEGPEAVAERLAGQSKKLLAEFDRAAAAVERLLRE